MVVLEEGERDFPNSRTKENFEKFAERWNSPRKPLFIALVSTYMDEFYTSHKFSDGFSLLS